MKKWIALLLVFAMAISLCACGGFTSGSNDDDDDDDDDGGSKNNGLVTAYKMTGATIISYDEDGNETLKAVVEYNDQFDIVGMKTYENDVLVTEQVFDKDPDRLLQSVNYDEDGKETSKTEYTYDADGNTLSFFYYKNGEQSSGYVYTYDTNGNELSYTSYEEGKVDSQKFYTYNADGLLEKETYKYIYDDGDTESWYLYEYDEQGNVVRETYGSADMVYSVIPTRIPTRTASWWKSRFTTMKTS